MRNLLSGEIEFKLWPQGNATLTRQFYDQLRGAILEGSLPPGHRLPSSRDLARQLKVSRNTISFVVDQLAMEGYLDVAQGRRPTVSAAVRPALLSGKALARRSPAGLRISKQAERLRQADWPFAHEGRPKAFQPGLADGREFPHDLWARCLRRAARNVVATAAVALNRPSLQAALLRHLIEHRGVRASARQIIITPSAQSSIDLIARVMLNHGDLAWLENPGYGGARVAFEAAGAKVRGIALDHHGLSIAGRTDRPRLIFVTPSHQYPTGGLMPVVRRQQLLGFATSAGSAVVEDDYDSEFHYEGRPVAALQGLDGDGRVFYVGTFSKSMFADIRIGYSIVPEALVDVFETAQRHAGQIVTATLQEALSEFIAAGHFAAHIRKMNRIYHGRRDRLVQALKAAAGGQLRIAPPAGGMQLLVQLEPHHDDRKVVADLAKAGVIARALSRHFIGKPAGRGLFLGFAAWNEQEIDAGAKAIGRTLRQWRKPD